MNEGIRTYAEAVEAVRRRIDRQNNPHHFHPTVVSTGVDGYRHLLRHGYVPMRIRFTKAGKKYLYFDPTGMVARLLEQAGL